MRNGARTAASSSKTRSSKSPIIDQAPNNDLLGSAQDNAQRDADDALAALDALEALGRDPRSLLHALVDTARAGIVGHSRGGTASLLAVSAEVAANGAQARLQAAVILAAPTHEHGGSTPLQLGDYRAVPLLSIGASQDGIAPFPEQLLAHQGAGPGSAIFRVVGGNHSQFKDSSDRILGDSPASISQAELQAVCRRYVTAWLAGHLQARRGCFRAYLPAGSIYQSDPRLDSRSP